MTEHLKDYLEAGNGGDVDLLDGGQEEEEEDWKAPVMMGAEGDARPVINNDHQRTIVHIDLDCFYAQVEMIRNPSLRDKPLGIQQKNIVVTTNYVARERYVGKLSYIKDALQKCPDLVLVSGEDLTHYREMSYRVTEVLQRFHPVVERLGFDENYIDVSSLVEDRLRKQEPGEKIEMRISGHLYCNEPIPECICGCQQRLTIGSQIAMEMREALYKELELTSCAGIAHNKLLAKLVGAQHKPNKQTMIYPEHAHLLMISLGKVRAIPGIGHSTGKRLDSMGISTIQDLIDASKTVLESQFGHQQACTMQQLAQGIDKTLVTATGLPQSISDEDSFKKCSTMANAKERMFGLLENLLKRLKIDSSVPQTIRVTVRKYSPKQWKRESRQCSLPPGTLKSLTKDENSTISKLLDICVGLFHKMVDSTKPFHLTLINICFAKMQAKPANINNFFSPKSPRNVRTTSQSKTPLDSNASVSGEQFLAATTSQIVSPVKDLSTESGDYTQHQTAPAMKSPVRTLESFFASPKRKRAKTCPDNEPDTFTNQTNRNKIYNSLDGFVSKGRPTSSCVQDESSSNISSLNRTAKQEQESTDLESMQEVKNQQSGDYAETGDLIPSHVDPDVFRELPIEVQQELRSEFLSDLRHQSVNTCIDDAQTHGSPQSERDTSISSAPMGSKGQHVGTVLTEAGDPMKSSGETSGCSVELQSPTQDITPSVNTSSEFDTKCEATTASNSSTDAGVNIPPDVDPVVFAGLPSEMKQELINDWKQKAYQISTVDLRHSSAGKRSHGLAKGRQKGKSISEYFKK